MSVRTATLRKAMYRCGRSGVRERARFDRWVRVHELPLLRLRALLARARGDEAGYRQFADRYRAMANDLGFEGHMAIAATM